MIVFMDPVTVTAGDRLRLCVNQFDAEAIAATLLYDGDYDTRIS